MSTHATPKVGLVGHCTPDASFLTMAVTKFYPQAKVERLMDDAAVDRAIEAGVDLLLVNRAMEPGYADGNGIDYIRRLRASHDGVKLMLISNYEDAQSDAVHAGALPGFGKNQLMSEEAGIRLKHALEESL